MSLFIPILQVILAAAGGFAVLALLLSHLRYRKLLLEARLEATSQASVAAAVMLMLDARREGRFCGLCLQPADPARAGELRQLLPSLTRRGDRHVLLVKGAVLSLIGCPLEHLPAVAKRLAAQLPQAGFPDGGIRLGRLEATPEVLLKWLEDGSPALSGGGWRVESTDWPSTLPAVEESELADPLTGVLRADLLPLAVRRRMAAHRRNARPLCILRVDLDQLEGCNRRFGREAGDCLLRTAGAGLLAHCRETDLVGRGEEDEFVLGLPGGPAEGLAAARRICAHLRSLQVRHGDAELRFTVCIGVASLPEHGTNPHLLMDRAGEALQSAKRRGRGECALYEQPRPPTRASAGLGKPDADAF